MFLLGWRPKTSVKQVNRAFLGFFQTKPGARWSCDFKNCPFTQLKVAESQPVAARVAPVLIAFED
jgi:hypothetical protein